MTLRALFFLPPATLQRPLNHTFHSLHHRRTPVMMTGKDKFQHSVLWYHSAASPWPEAQIWCPAGGECWKLQATKWRDSPYEEIHIPQTKLSHCEYFLHICVYIYCPFLKFAEVWMWLYFRESSYNFVAALLTQHVGELHFQPQVTANFQTGIGLRNGYYSF